MYRGLVPAAIALAMVTAPPAVAYPGEFHYVRTVSGAVRCVISADHVGCERTSAEGFPGAPKSQSGSGNWNIAGVDADGPFNWGEGNIGGGDNEVTLALRPDLSLQRLDRGAVIQRNAFHERRQRSRHVRQPPWRFAVVTN